MDGKKLIEYGVIAVIAWFVLTWLFGTVQTVSQSFGQSGQPDPYQSPMFYPRYAFYGARWGGSPVRWRGEQGQGGGYTGRPMGAGGY